jgi:hypothetical protein
MRTDRAAQALMGLDPAGKGAVEWKEVSKKVPAVNG